MEGYLETYGVGEEHRNRVIKRIVLVFVALLVVALLAFLFFKNFPERQAAKSFLGKVNSHDYRAAYAEWGCTEKTPCPNYDFARFMRDWSPENVTGPWKVESSDSCNTFLTVNVQAPGSELESIAVQRSDHSLGFAPAPECQERKLHWKAFFQHLFHKDEAAPPPPHS
jgi:hypothetical protein